MYEESAISLFKKLPETKAEIKKFAMLVRQQMDDGDVRNPLQFAARIKAMAKLAEVLFDDIIFKDTILERAEKYGVKSFDEGNANFRIQETGTKYNYDDCLDTEYEQICSEFNKWAAKKKDKEDFLKTIKPDQTVFGSDGIQLMPPGKTSTTSVVITLK